MTCETCEKQPRGRRQPPLECMQYLPEEQGEYIDINGRGTQESYYVCRECGHKWIHETGNCGMGWQP
ncbi:TPA: hypothetical protein MJD06_04520 [Klebsiella pneumoniae]|nr:hypothetical protein DX995_07020 [Klebsiella pneumoniae]HBX2119011.1 hypothetical protein [Klebsiella pneumoniae]HBY7720918.1 hypothetical protein [Klebsiella pneumoniae]HBZ0987023.1 hypothetical protein [Klebsiella pneumoniae]